MALNCTFTVSPNLIVGQLLPDEFWERNDCNELFDREVEKLRKLGNVESYLDTHNQEIDEAKKLKKKNFFRGYYKANIKGLMAYFTRLEGFRVPIVQLKLIG